jgi:predicted transcriptional regulator
MPRVQVINWEAAEEVLTPKRREQIETLRNSEVESVQGLAREVGRDKPQANHDLGLLAEHGVIQYGKDSNTKQSRLTQQHIVVELLSDLL